MKRLILSLLAACVGTASFGETVVATTAIRSQTILTPAHLAVVTTDIAGGVSDPALLVGLETRVNLYPNRPVMMRDVGAPRVIERNQIVSLSYVQRGLSISVDARSLGVAGLGDSLRVMNLASRTIVSGIVVAPGRVQVGASQ